MRLGQSGLSAGIHLYEVLNLLAFAAAFGVVHNVYIRLDSTAAIAFSILSGLLFISSALTSIASSLLDRKS